MSKAETFRHCFVIRHSSFVLYHSIVRPEFFGIFDHANPALKRWAIFAAVNGRVDLDLFAPRLD